MVGVNLGDLCGHRFLSSSFLRSYFFIFDFTPLFALRVKKIIGPEGEWKTIIRCGNENSEIKYV